MATYVPNATQTTEPVESRTVESAALEFRTLKESVNTRIAALTADFDALEAVTTAEDAKDLRVPEATVAPLPAIAARAGKVLAFDAGGDPTVLVVGESADSSLRTDLAAPSGSSLVGYDTGTVQDVLDAVTGENGAASVGYMPAGTGAVATTVAEALDTVVNILSFCVGDGVADDSTKALLAVAHANTVNKALYVPPHANILISGSTTLNPKYGMYGGGRISRGVTGWTGSSPIVLIDTDRQFVEGIRFVVNGDTSSNDGVVANLGASGIIEISGSPKNVRVTNNYMTGGRFGIWPYGGDGVFISGNVIHTLSDAGVYVGYNIAYPKAGGGGDVKNVTITNNRIYSISNVSIGGTIGDGIKTVAKCYNLHIQGNHISGCRGDAIDTFVSGDKLRIIGNTLFDNQTKGIDVKSDEANYPAATWGQTREVSIQGNHIYGNGIIGIAVAATASSVTCVNISNNAIHDNAQWGIVFDGYAGVISGNLVYSNGAFVQSYAAGIRVEGAPGNHCQDVVVSANVCINNGCAGQTNSCGIVVFGYVDNVSITGNVCNSVVYLSNSGNQDYGIYVSAEASNVTVRGNRCTGNSVLGIGMANNSDVTGDTATVLVGDVSASKDVIVANMPQQAAVIRGRVMTTTAIAADASNYWEFRLRRKSTDGSVETGIVTKNTSATALSAWAKFQFNTLPSLTDKDETVFLKFVKNGTPSNLTGLTAQIDYVSW